MKETGITGLREQRNNGKRKRKGKEGRAGTAGSETVGENAKRKMWETDKEKLKR